MFDPIEITKLLVFGTNSPSPDDYNEHIRPTNATPASITYNMSDYMTVGGGRFAYPSLFGMVEEFFNATLPDNTYTLNTLETQLGKTFTADDFRVGISQYGTGIGSADHPERSYIFGTTAFRLDTSMATFEVVGGVKTIKNIEVRAFDDNFDFDAGNPLAELINTLFLEPTLDPYELARGAVDITFSGSGRNFASYSESNFATDEGLESGVSVVGTLSRPIKDAAGIAALPPSFLSNIASDTFLSYERGDLKVIYGTPGADNLDEFDAELSFDIYFGFLIVGGAGNDILTGGVFADELQGGEGNDNLDGGLGNDIFIGGGGDDNIEGGSFLFGLLEGTDTAVYRGSLGDYEIEFLPDDTVRITDKIGSRDGADTLTGVDFAQFSDKSISLAPGQDVAFVIDTTGSMFDDIAAVKSQASQIINAIYDAENGFLDSRIAVVGYNDPGTFTFLSFTDQPKIDDRKTAAINAINSISVGGGGDFPELVNSGLIRALDGRAGQWREEAIARRIILFGDAPPKDTDLRPAVLSLAADVGVTISNNIASFSIPGEIETSEVTDGLAVTRFEIAAVTEDGSSMPIPVEIFTILIGNDLTTRTDFASLANATGGQAFTAANASEIVKALIEALGSPIAVNDSGIGFITDEDTSFTTANILDNDNDPDSNEPLSIINVDTTGTIGLISDNGDGTFDYDPNGQFEFLNAGETATDTFTYSISDSDGLIDTATVTITINGVDEVNVIDGTPDNDRLLGIDEDNLIRAGKGNDLLSGNSGSDELYGEGGNDRLYGFGNNDVLIGGDGVDWLLGGEGDDVLDGGGAGDRISGGTGKDTFVLALGNGVDAITDFEQGIDTFRLDGGLSFSQLSFESNGNTTVIQVTDTDEQLAQLNGTFVLGIADFA
jgi:VCBS repeat-containing protein